MTWLDLRPCKTCYSYRDQLVHRHPLYRRRAREKSRPSRPPLSGLRFLSISCSKNWRFPLLKTFPLLSCVPAISCWIVFCSSGFAKASWRRWLLFRQLIWPLSAVLWRSAFRLATWIDERLYTKSRPAIVKATNGPSSVLEILRFKETLSYDGSILLACRWRFWTTWSPRGVCLSKA